MFNFRTRPPPPPSGQPPSYAFVQRISRRNLRPAVIFCSSLSALWALIWTSSAFRSIDDDRTYIPQYVTFDIVLGSLFAAIAVIEIFGVITAITTKLQLVLLYCWLSVVGALMALTSQLIGFILHFTLKQAILDECAKKLTGLTVHTGTLFDDSLDQLDAGEAASVCKDQWSRGIFSGIAWLIVILLLALLFVSLNFSYYRQLLDPSSVRQTPSNSYRMFSRTPYQPHGPIPGYNPYQGYPDYVPPYDPHRPPGYTTGQWDGPGGDIKDANEFQHVSNTGAPTGTFAPPPGPPPGLGATTATTANRPGQDEGFDPTLIQAALHASETEQRLKKDDGR